MNTNDSFDGRMTLMKLKYLLHFFNYFVFIFRDKNEMSNAVQTGIGKANYFINFAIFVKCNSTIYRFTELDIPYVTNIVYYIRAV